MSFHVGQEIICVEPKLVRITDPSWIKLEKERIYTVRKYGQGIDGRACVWLNEIIRPINRELGWELGYFAARFRPLIKTDISVFTKMLTTIPNEQTVTRVLQEMS